MDSSPSTGRPDHVTDHGEQSLRSSDCHYPPIVLQRYPFCVYFANLEYTLHTLVIHSECMCGKGFKHYASVSESQYGCECGRQFDIRKVACKLCGNFCVGILRKGMSSSDICSLCGIDHQMPESVLRLRQSGVVGLLRRSFMLRLTVMAAGIGILIGVFNLILPQ